MKQIKYLIFAITVSFVVSCDTDTFLNPLPDTTVVVESFFQTDEDVLAGVIGVYDALQGVNENTQTNIGNFNRGVQFEHLLTEHRTDNTRNATLEGSKSDFHRYIVTSNNVESEDYYASMYEVIFRANNIMSLVDIADESNQASYIAELKFLRAYAYFKLVRMYGAVPLVTSVVASNDNDALFIRVSEEQVYAQIVEDLQEAVNVLDNTHKGRASQAAAQAILAKVYLSQPSPNYSGAQTMCESIVNGGEFSLEANFRDIFYNELNDEIIFAIQYEFGNSLESQSFSSEFTSNQRQGREDGQNIVNENLINDFAVYGGNRTAESFATFGGTSNEVIKFLPEGSDITTSPPTYGGNARNAGNDYIAVRYADVLLMHTEAIMAGGAETTNAAAIDSYMAVRVRAGFDAMADRPSLLTKDALLAERRVELAFENQRWFDLLRFGVANDVLTAHATEMGYSYDARDLLLPIPSREINISGGLLTQNPGY